MLQCCKVTMLQCCVVAMLRCCVVAMLRCCVVALLRCCVVALLQSYNVAMLQSYNVAMLQCCNVAKKGSPLREIKRALKEMGKKVDSLRFCVLSKGYEKCISAHKDFHVFFLYEKMRQIPHKNLVVYKIFFIFVK